MSAPATFADFQDALLPYLPGALPSVVQDVFCTMARTFFRRTRVWRAELGAFAVNQDSGAVPLNPVDQYADVCFIEAARLGQDPLMVCGRGEFINWTGRSRPTRVWLEDPHTAQLWPVPLAPVDEELALLVSMQPRRDVDHYPPESLTHYYEGLISGTLGALLAHPKKPYSDPVMAATHTRRFETEIARARGTRERGFVNAPFAFTPPNVPLR